MQSASQNLTAEERKERKRIQNRLNQRARRQRLKAEEDATPKNQKHPYRVDRWRLPDPSVSTDTSKSTTDTPGISTVPKASRINASPNKGFAATRSGPSDDIELPLSADHLLLHLIAHNVCRGLLSNKSLLRLLATFINVDIHMPVSKDFTPCRNAVVRPSHRAIPDCLVPTQLQMNSAHPTWMDMIPFPRIRDNLITRQFLFHHMHFLEDLIGDLKYVVPRNDELTLPVSLWDPQNKDDTQADQVTKGLVLWGEPYLKESWEVTACFLAKWAWVAEGCGDIIEISNGWRIIRGEDALVL
ncbi:hypothetical protein QQX98_002610 [Neonectria punicea]|uniref:BZIP domain-containing protein n=1 Tax=Neonectria punicea TaxID=979145 RepID=A0ABR1HI87_9HYPO